MSRKFTAGPGHVIQSYMGNMAPKGTKLHILDFGGLKADEGFFALNFRNPKTGVPLYEQYTKDGFKYMMMFGVLISHPAAGCIVYDPGPGLIDSYEREWGTVCDCFQPLDAGNKEYALDTQVKKAGYSMSDVKHIILSHLHMDHAGGLMYFKGRDDVKTWVSELEYKHAFWTVGALHAKGAYCAHYLDFDYNWSTLDCAKYPTIDILPGITIHHIPGHSPGLIAMQVNLPETGPVFFVSDHAHFREAFELHVSPGWIMQDHNNFYRSQDRIEHLSRFTNAPVVVGHDREVVETLMAGRPFLT